MIPHGALAPTRFPTSMDVGSAEIGLEPIRSGGAALHFQRPSNGDGDDDRALATHSPFTRASELNRQGGLAAPPA